MGLIDIPLPFAIGLAAIILLAAAAWVYGPESSRPQEAQTGELAGRADNRHYLPAEVVAALAVALAGVLIDASAVTARGYPIGTSLYAWAAVLTLLPLARTATRHLPAAPLELLVALRGRLMRRHMVGTAIAAVPMLLLHMHWGGTRTIKPFSNSSAILHTGLTPGALITLALFALGSWYLLAPLALEAAARRRGYTSLVEVREDDTNRVLRGADVGEALDYSEEDS